MRAREWTLLYVLAAGSNIVRAAPVDYMQAYQACLKAAGRTNNGSVGYCSETVAEQAQAEMDRLVGQIRASLQAEIPDEAAKMLQAQQSWTAYRNSHCALAGAHIGGPMYSYCPLVQNIRRVEELRELAEARAVADENEG